MASLNMAFGMATKGSGSAEGEKGLLDWILGGLLKQDQLMETDPILDKVDGKSPTIGSNKSTTSVSIPGKKKFPGFGGLFAKN